MKKLIFFLTIILMATIILPSCSTSSRTSRGFNYASHAKKQKKNKGKMCKAMRHHLADRKNMVGVH